MINEPDIMESSKRVIPRWLLALMAVTLLLISAWTIREIIAPRASWVMVEKIGVDGEPALAWYLLDQRTGIWCIVPLVGSSPKLGPKHRMLSPSEFDRAKLEPAPPVCHQLSSGEIIR